MPLVLDASLAMAWCYPDEGGATVDRVMSAARATTVAVPGHFIFEVANAISVGLRRKRLTDELATSFAEALDDLDIRVATDVRPSSIAMLARSALNLDLTAYDFAYLDLALTLRCPLATLDAALARAARESGLQVMGATS